MTKNIHPLFLPLFICVASLLLTPTTCWALLLTIEGNAPQSPSNYEKWPGLVEVVNQKSRVMLVWGNGNENCYYRGNTAALNQTLRDFSQVDLKEHRVVILPEPLASHKNRGKSLSYSWRLHIVNGIAAFRFTGEPNQNEFYDVDPTLYVHAGKSINLSQLEIPEGMNVLGEDDLRKRYRKATESASPRVVEFALPMIASLNMHHLEDAQLITGFLKDKNARVRSAALRSLKRYGKEAKPVIPELQAYATQYPQNADAIKELIDHFSSTEPQSKADKQYLTQYKLIQEFLKNKRD